MYKSCGNSCVSNEPLYWKLYIYTIISGQIQAFPSALPASPAADRLVPRCLRRCKALVAVISGSLHDNLVCRVAFRPLYQYARRTT